jgi:hypothetical protein
MKNAKLIGLMLSVSFLANSQAPARRTYKFLETEINVPIRNPIPAHRANSLTDVTIDREVFVTRTDGTNVYFVLDTTTSSSSLTNEELSLPIARFNSSTIPRYNRFKGVGVRAYTIPIRLRGIRSKSFDFESNISLGANVVFGFGKSYDENSVFDLAAGFALTQIKLTTINSNVDRNAGAFTFSTGAIFKPNKLVNLGVFVGWDFLGASDLAVNWKFNGKSWLGIGINISMNDVNTTSTDRSFNEFTKH